MSDPACDQTVEMTRRFYGAALVTFFAMGAAGGFFAASYMTPWWARALAFGACMVAVIAKESRGSIGLKEIRQ